LSEAGKGGTSEADAFGSKGEMVVLLEAELRVREETKAAMAFTSLQKRENLRFMVDVEAFLGKILKGRERWINRS